MKCHLVGDMGCLNTSVGNQSIQGLDCARMLTGCTNSNFSPDTNVQSITCANATGTNNGLRTNVFANGVDNCSSNGPDTTTICQPNRIIIR